MAAYRVPVEFDAVDDDSARALRDRLAEIVAEATFGLRVSSAIERQHMSWYEVKRPADQ